MRLANIVNGDMGQPKRRRINGIFFKIRCGLLVAAPVGVTVAPIRHGERSCKQRMKRKSQETKPRPMRPVSGKAHVGPAMEMERWKVSRAQFAVAPVACCRESEVVEPARARATTRAAPVAGACAGRL